MARPEREVLERTRPRRATIRQSVMPVAAGPFPADLALRRQLWRQWTHTDAPQGERHRQIRRATPRPIRAADIANLSIDATPGVVQGLKRAIVESIVDGKLRHGDRERLVARAMRLGLDRFQANLLVAAVQHAERTERGIPEPGDVRIIRRSVRPVRRTRLVAKLVGVCLGLEAIGVAGAVWWLNR